jgi:hypothetical protein
MTSLLEEFINKKSSTPIIIFGSPRSGTTYLLEIINHHPDIKITYEARVFRWLFMSQVKLVNDESAVYKNRDVFIEIARRHAKQTIQEFYQQLFPATQYWGDKNPFYGENPELLENIEEFFPGTHFIHIIRDPRDVATSLMRKQTEGQPWSTFENALNLWLQLVTYGCQFAERNPDVNYLEIRYEDIVGNDVEAAKLIFDFLNIEIRDPVINFCEKQLRNRTLLSGPTRDLQAQGGLSSDWATYLTKQQQLESLEKTGPWLAKLGYLDLKTLHQQKFQLKASINSELKAQ